MNILKMKSKGRTLLSEYLKNNKFDSHRFAIYIFKAKGITRKEALTLTSIARSMENIPDNELEKVLCDKIESE